jgi:quercetin dioxygenase-like cupin family protein
MDAGDLADNRPTNSEEETEEAVSNLVDLETVQPFDVWGEAVRARKIEGERQTLAVVELAPNAVVPEHRHESEQIGICIEGSITFTIDGETRQLGPGGTWRILSNRPHVAQAGPDGAIVIDVFAPVRSDWQFEMLEPRTPVWPRRPR